MKNKTVGLLSGILLGFSTMSHAQVPVVGNLPIVGGLLGGNSSGGIMLD
ncbi:hypothetical protein [Zhongshania marina]